MSHIPVWIHTKFISFNLTARHWTFKHLVKGAGHDAWLTCDSFYDMVSIFFFLILKIKSIIIFSILGKIVLHSSKEIISNMFDKSAFTIQKVQHELLLMQHSVPRGYIKELGNVHKWCLILGGVGGSSKIGQNRTRGVGSLAKIGHPIFWYSCWGFSTENNFFRNEFTTMCFYP